MEIFNILKIICFEDTLIASVAGFIKIDSPVLSFPVLSQKLFN